MRKYGLGGGYHYLNSKKYGLIFACLLSAGIFGVFGYSALSVSPALAATTADSEVTLDLAPIIGISATDVQIDLSPNGTTARNFATGVSNVTVSTNNITGYNLSIEGKDGITYLHNEDADNNITSITGTDITSSAFQAGTWGYSKTSGDSATYNAIPNVATEINRTISTAVREITPIYFGVKVDSTIPSGRYQGTVTFTALANFVPETEGKEILTVAPTTIEPTGGEILATTNIDYSEAMGEITGSISNGENTITCQKSSDDVSTILNFSETENNKLQVSCYIPETDKIGENYALTLNLTKFNESYTSGAVITIEEPAKTFFTATTMQQVAISPQFCSSATTPAKNATAIDETGAYAGNTSYIPQTTLVDTREGSINSYIIRKLADGNCWMVQNLNYGDTITSDGAYLSATNSDVESTCTENNRLAECKVTKTTSFGSDNPPLGGYIYDNGDKWFTNGTTSTTTKPSDTTQAGTRYIGNYYNFWSATANHMTQTSPNYSICPKGWQLPASSGNESWYNLVATTYVYSISNDSATSSTASGTTILNGPIQLVRSGVLDNASVNHQGWDGSFWTGVQSNSTSGYLMYFNGGDMGLQNSNLKRYGRSIRCVSRQ